MAIMAAASRFSPQKWAAATVPPCSWVVVRPRAQGRLHGAADLCLARPVRAPGHDVALEAHQDHVAHHVLPVLLADIYDRVSAPRDVGLAGELLRAGEEAAPLALEQVHHVQVLGLRLVQRALGREEVDVGVAAVPAAPVHVGPAFQAQGELALAGLDGEAAADGLVLEPPGDVDYDLAPWAASPGTSHRCRRRWPGPCAGRRPRRS